MQIQARPDHSIRIPRPDLSIKIGTPSACNNCHSDKSPQWAADHVVAWYGAKPNREVHYGEIFAAARAGDSVVPQLEQLVLDLKYPAIVRATAVHYLSDSELHHSAGVGIDARVHATRDADPEVRAAAAESLAAIAPDQRLRLLAPLLSDPLRAVRIAAANALSSIPTEQMNTEQRHDFDNALAEYIAAQKVALDMPGAQFNLGVVYQNTGKLDLAEQYYLSALRIDPDFVPARSNLATLYNALSRNDDAERVLVEGLQRQPRTGDLQYSLGLLLAEEKRMAEAADALTQAARLLPNNARVHYSLGLALQHLNRRKPAEVALLKAFELAPDDAAIPYALAIFYRQSGQYDKARIWTEKLQALAPNDAQSIRLAP
jgi:tetratricopeptide (TPR) repeat protein